jgi:hypothetical protein
VYVNPAPAITNIFRTICTGTSFVVTPTSGTDGFVPIGTTYTWGLPTVTNNSVTGGQSNSTPASSIFGGDLFNPTSSSQTAVYYVVPVLGTCIGAGFSVFITIDPKPNVTPMSTVVCSGVQFVVSPQDGSNGVVPANTRYAWSAPSGTNIGNGQTASNQLTINGTLTNSVNVQRTATYLVTPSFGACSGLSLSGNQFTVTVFVDPTPAITSFTTSPICTGTSFAVTPTTAGNIIPSNTLYGWGAPIPEVASLSGGQPSAFSSTNIFSGTLFNPTKQQYDYVYTVTPQAGNCVGATFNVTVPIDPKPFVPALSTTICNGVFVVTPTPTTDGFNGTVPVNTFYSWNAPTVSTTLLTGGQTGTGTTSITGSLNNATSVTQTAVYEIIPSIGACTGANGGSMFTLTVFVNPAPAINQINRTICTGTSFVVTPTTVTDGFVPDGTTYTWTVPSYGNGALSGGDSRTSASVNIFGGNLINPTNAPQTVVYTVTPQVGNCPGTPFQLIITVDPKPQVNPMSTIICSGVQFVVSPANITNGLVPAGTNYSWNQPSVSNASLTGGNTQSGLSVFGTLTNQTNFQQTATYLVIPSYGACSGLTLSGSPFTVTVSVNPAAIISTINTTVCSGVTFRVTLRLRGRPHLEGLIDICRAVLGQKGILRLLP